MAGRTDAPHRSAPEGPVVVPRLVAIDAPAFDLAQQRFDGVLDASPSTKHIVEYLWELFVGE
jgi:hypothetical protein